MSNELIIPHTNVLNTLVNSHTQCTNTHYCQAISTRLSNEGSVFVMCVRMYVCTGWSHLGMSSSDTLVDPPPRAWWTHHREPGYEATDTHEH